MVRGLVVAHAILLALVPLVVAAVIVSWCRSWRRGWRCRGRRGRCCCQRSWSCVTYDLVPRLEANGAASSRGASVLLVAVVLVAVVLLSSLLAVAGFVVRSCLVV